MTQLPAWRAGRCLLAAALPLLLASRCFFGFSSDDDVPPAPPPEAYVSIDRHDAKVDTTSIGLLGDVQCPECFASDWQYGFCPVITCPATTGAVSWTNSATGAEAPAAHGIAPTCYCPVFAGGYCYTACSHAWWATVPLAFGDNAIEVAADLPGYLTGTASTIVQRVPVAPSWIGAEPGPGQLWLSWNPVADATSYNLYWSTTPYGWSSLCTKIEGVASPFLHAGLASGTEYYYFVTARVDDAESFDSLRLAATPQ